ncbi:unnamed protein product [Amoebophrya sp. A120]|nr:unnamed protein product [Amoebophrya sp. A120]|eukprot:GSA120T00012601001.1
MACTDAVIPSSDGGDSWAGEADRGTNIEPCSAFDAQGLAQIAYSLDKIVRQGEEATGERLLKDRWLQFFLYCWFPAYQTLARRSSRERLNRTTSGAARMPGLQEQDEDRMVRAPANKTFLHAPETLQNLIYGVANLSEAYGRTHRPKLWDYRIVEFARLWEQEFSNVAISCGLQQYDEMLWHSHRRSSLSSINSLNAMQLSVCLYSLGRLRTSVGSEGAAPRCVAMEERSDTAAQEAAEEIEGTTDPETTLLDLDGKEKDDVSGLISARSGSSSSSCSLSSKNFFASWLSAARRVETDFTTQGWVTSLYGLGLACGSAEKDHASGQHHGERTTSGPFFRESRSTEVTASFCSSEGVENDMGNGIDNGTAAAAAVDEDPNAGALMFPAELADFLQRGIENNVLSLDDEEEEARQGLVQYRRATSVHSLSGTGRGLHNQEQSDGGILICRTKFLSEQALSLSVYSLALLNLVPQASYRKRWLSCFLGRNAPLTPLAIGNIAFAWATFSLEITD